MHWTTSLQPLRGTRWVFCFAVLAIGLIAPPTVRAECGAHRSTIPHWGAPSLSMNPLVTGLQTNTVVGALDYIPKPAPACDGALCGRRPVLPVAPIVPLAPKAESWAYLPPPDDTPQDEVRYLRLASDRPLFTGRGSEVFHPPRSSSSLA